MRAQSLFARCWSPSGRQRTGFNMCVMTSLGYDDTITRVRLRRLWSESGVCAGERRSDSMIMFLYRRKRCRSAITRLLISLWRKRWVSGLGAATSFDVFLFRDFLPELICTRPWISTSNAALSRSPVKVVLSRGPLWHTGALARLVRSAFCNQPQFVTRCP